MDEEYRYKKKIKDDVDYPAYCYFFISSLLRWAQNSVVKDDDKITIEIKTNDGKHPYCYDAFELVVKTLERKGYSTRIPSFKRYVVEGGHDILYYRFTIGKLVNCDDLPF